MLLGGWSGARHVTAVSSPERAQNSPACPGRHAEACGARPRPPASVPAPWPAAPPPRGVPGRSSPPRRPRAARGRREYAVGWCAGRPARDGAGRLAAVSRRRLLNGEGRGWGPHGGYLEKRPQALPCKAGVLASIPVLSHRRCLGYCWPAGIAPRLPASSFV